MESKNSHPDRGIAQQMHGLEQMIAYLSAGKTTAFDLDRLDRFIASQNLQNGIAPELKEKLFEILLRLRLEQIANQEYPIGFRNEKLSELEGLVRKPGNAPQSFFEKMDTLFDDTFRLRVKDDDLRFALLGLRMQLDGIIARGKKASEFPRRREPIRTIKVFNERQYSRSLDSGEWRIQNEDSKKARAASVPYPMQGKK